MSAPPRKLLLCLAAVPIWLAVIELGYRGWLALSHRAYSAAGTRAALLAATSKLVEPIMLPSRTEEDITRETTSSLSTLAPHPFAGVESACAFDVFATDAETCRPGRDPDEYVIIMLGGSVANIFLEEDSDLMRDAIAADPRFHGKHITVLNYSRAGMKQPQQVTMAAWLFSAGFHPDAVINLDGYNETALFQANVQAGAHPLYPFFPMWGHVASEPRANRTTMDAMLAVRATQDEGWTIAHRALELHLYESAVLGNIALMRLDRIRSQMAQAYEGYVASMGAAPENKLILGPPYASDRQSLDRMMVDCWVQSSLSLRGMCAARDAVYLHVLQPTLHDAGSKPLTQAEIDAGSLDDRLIRAVRRGYPMLRSAGKELVARGVNFADASDTFANVTEPIYYDFCHFKGLGNRMLAARIAKEFLHVLPPAAIGMGNRASK